MEIRSSPLFSFAHPMPWLVVEMLHGLWGSAMLKGRRQWRDLLLFAFEERPHSKAT